MIHRLWQGQHLVLLRLRKDLKQHDRIRMQYLVKTRMFVFGNQLQRHKNYFSTRLSKSVHMSPPSQLNCGISCPPSLVAERIPDRWGNDSIHPTIQFDNLEQPSRMSPFACRSLTQLCDVVIIPHSGSVATDAIS